MNKLPISWATAELGEIASFVMGQAPNAKDCNMDGVGSVFVKAGEFGKAIPIVREWTTKPLKFAESGDVLICVVGATAGKLNLAIDCAIGRSVAAIRPEFETPQKYIYYFLVSQTEKLRQGSTGSAQGVISKPDLAGITIPLAPGAEQTRIAQKLDELLAQVDTLKARINAIPSLLKHFRQSILASAVSGRLTEEWRQCGTKNPSNEKLPLPPDNIEIYAEDSVYAPDGWTLTALGNLCSFQQGLQIAKSERRPTLELDTLPILRTINYENDFTEDVHYATITKKSIIAEQRDIILSRTGTVGRVLTGHRGIMHNNSFRINFNEQHLSREFLICYLRSPQCQSYIKKKSGKSSQPDLTHKEFSKSPIIVPPCCEQTEIVRRVEQLFAFADQLEVKVASAKSRIDHLTQSILAKAFRGELVPQAPNDEPASVLLERMRAQRSAAPKAKRGRKST